MSVKPLYINREISWLDFNARVLQEADDKNVPLLERLRFLGIFSNNLDEFFQVRYATVQRISQSSKTGKRVFAGRSAEALLKEITQKVIVLQTESLNILHTIYQEMEKENIFFIDHNQVLPEQEEFLKDYFLQYVNPALVTIILSQDQSQDLSSNKAFIVVTLDLDSEDESDEKLHALIEIPKEVKRFIVLPKGENGRQYVMMLDDLIRYHFKMIFSFFKYKKIEAHMVKITRDAELDLEEDVSKSYVEKITNGEVKGKTGSLTALPIIETQAGDVSAFVPTNVISITDGQIFLETDLFNSGIRPAINAGLSVSRVGGAAQTKAIKKLGGGIRLDLAQYRELAAFAQFASDLDAETKAQIDRGQRVTELMKQAQYSPLNVAETATSLFAANSGALDDIEVKKVVVFEAALLAYMNTNQTALMDSINESGDYNDDIEAQLQAAIDDFKANNTW